MKFAQYSPNSLARVTNIWRVARFREFEYSPKTANFWRVLEFAKFAGEWPLLSRNTKVIKTYQIKLTVELILIMVSM
jgi:hypothetical protein